MAAEKKTKHKPLKDIIVQHNNLVEARYRLSLQEKRIVLWLSSQVTSFDKDFKEHHLSVKEFAEMTNTQGENLYTNLQTITRRLMQRIITLRPIGEKRLIQVAWLGAADYKTEQGIISLSFHPHLKPFFLQLKDNFTKINIVDIMCLKSIYSIRIYEILKQYEYIRYRIIDIKDLRDICGITSEQYKQINDLQRYVLNISQREINQKTDLEISYSMIKKGRKYVSVEFKIKKNKKKDSFDDIKLFKKMSQEAKKQDLMIRDIQSFGFSRNTISKMISDISDFDIEQAIRSVEIQIQNGNVKNPKAMLRTALREKWKPDVFNPKRT
jgi:plasmid replication initiation protein